VLLVENGTARPLVLRETVDDLVRRQNPF